MFTKEDLQQISQKGISEAEVLSQLKRIEEGFPFLELKGAAAVGNGIMKPTDEETDAYCAKWDAYLAAGHTVTKFVPASGAASRMFKDLFAFLSASYDEPQSDTEKQFFANLDKAAFKEALDDACTVLYGLDIESLKAEKRYKDIVAALLGDEGLGYGQKPKGVLQFHAYDDCVRTPVEEHLVEGALYARSADGKVHIHFTVSPQHRALFQNLVESVVPRYEEAYDAAYDVTFSEQKSATDTIAAAPDGTPFRNADGTLLFRPAGHGALLSNLADISSDVVFIKNIDNVVPDRLKGDTVRYKKLLAGVLVSVQQQIGEYLAELRQSQDPAAARKVLPFLESTLCCTSDATATMTDAELREYVERKLRRPIRVCGMVRNVGEAGGGPFLAVSADGSVQPQILESSQIDTSDPEKKRMFEEGTHFNPVDLVCALRDSDGKPFCLPDFVDPQTGFISEKSKDGRPLKALELPGLWNGSMSDWNTIFVEVPLSTFNPVKTVSDLYRPEHLAL